MLPVFLPSRAGDSLTTIISLRSYIANWSPPSLIPPEHPSKKTPYFVLSWVAENLLQNPTTLLALINLLSKGQFDSLSFLLCSPQPRPLENLTHCFCGLYSLQGHACCHSFPIGIPRSKLFIQSSRQWAKSFFSIIAGVSLWPPLGPGLGDLCCMSLEFVTDCHGLLSRLETLCRKTLSWSGSPQWSKLPLCPSTCLGMLVAIS